MHRSREDTDFLVYCLKLRLLSYNFNSNNTRFLLIEHLAIQTLTFSKGEVKALFGIQSENY